MNRFATLFFAFVMVGAVGGCLYLVEKAFPQAHAQAVSFCGTGRACSVSSLKVGGLSTSGTNTGDVTLGAIGSSANANGATLTGQVLNLEPASASFGGVVTTGAQTIAGAKTFSSAVNSSVAASANAYTCTNTGCRLSLGNTARYLIDDGSYFTLNTGLNVTGSGALFNIYDSGETGLAVTRTGVIGARTTPVFTFGRIIAGGINEPNARILYSDSTISEQPIAVFEGRTGTFATVSHGVGYGSSVEGYNYNGQVYPFYRALSSTTEQRYELGPGGRAIAAAGCTRATNVVTCTTTLDHDFAVNDSVKFGSADGDFAVGPFTLTAIPSSTQIRYSETGADGSTAAARYVSADTDVFFARTTRQTGVLRVGSTDIATLTTSAISTPGTVTYTGSGSAFIANNSGAEVGIGLDDPASRLHVLSEASSNTPSAFSADHFIVGREAASGANSGGVFIQYNSTGNVGLIGSLSPGTAWRDLILASTKVRIQRGDGNELITLDDDGIITSGAASGTNGLAFSTSGARADLGSGSSDYLKSDSTNIITGSTSTPLCIGDTTACYQGGTKSLKIMHAASASTDVAAITAGTCNDAALTVDITGAALTTASTPCFVAGATAGIAAKVVPYAWASDADTVTIRLCCNDSSNCDPADQVYTVTCIQ